MAYMFWEKLGFRSEICQTGLNVFLFLFLLIKLYHSKSNQMLVFGERGKAEYPGKNLSEQRVENQQTQATYDGG